MQNNEFFTDLYVFYEESYGGDFFDTETDFTKYANRAYLLLNLYCGNLDTASALEALLEPIQTAICLQADFMFINGYEMSVEGMSEGGFTVGKVRIDGKSTTETDGKWLSFLSPLALNALASVGLGARQIPVAQEPFAPYPWRW